MLLTDPVEVAAVAGGEWLNGRMPQRMGDFCIDTRILRRGDVFVALCGDSRDGHHYLDTAASRGAAAALVCRPQPQLDLAQLVVGCPQQSLQRLGKANRQSFRAPVVGISGSSGKTTVKEMLGRILGQQWFRTPGNLNNHLGVPLSLLRLDASLHAGALLEAGINQRGEMEQLADWIAPTAAVITGVGPAHLEGLGDLAGVAWEKSRLVAAVPAGGDVFLPAYVLEYACFAGLAHSHSIHAVHPQGVEMGPGAAAVRQKISIYHYKWTEAVAAGGLGIWECPDLIPSRSLGFADVSTGMVCNLSLALLVALRFGVPVDTLDARLDNWQAPTGRGRVVERGLRQFFVDCYNANPDSMRDSVERFQRRFGSVPALYVFGGMNELGADAAEWHRRTGASIRMGNAQAAYVLGPHGEAFRAGLIAAGAVAERVLCVADLTAIEAAIEVFSGPVFLKGSRSFALERLVGAEGEGC